MNAVPIQEDGNLPAAKTQLGYAIGALIDPRATIINAKVVHSPSLYMQLWDAVKGEQSNAGTGGGSKSRPPFWIDAFDLCNEIDIAVEALQPAFRGVPPTVGRFRGILERGWRPQDVHHMEQIVTACKQWTASILELMNPTPKWTLPSPCPRCGTKTVYRRDAGGEMVRRPALEINPDGCKCVKCHASWPPPQFEFLSELLGYENSLRETPKENA